MLFPTCYPLNCSCLRYCTIFSNQKMSCISVPVQVSWFCYSYFAYVFYSPSFLSVYRLFFLFHQSLFFSQSKKYDPIIIGDFLLLVLGFEFNFSLPQLNLGLKLVFIFSLRQLFSLVLHKLTDWAFFHESLSLGFLMFCFHGIP